MSTRLPAWASHARFYQIYPLGCCGAPTRLESLQPVMRLEQLHDWIPHLQSLGINAVYLGPVFSSSTHGYDTRDYYHVDPRLGDHDTLRHLVNHFHAHGIRVILDAVLNHVGRDFWAFKDLQHHRQYSAYAHWFQRLNFNRRSRLGDPFTYQTWKGHPELVKLNLNQKDVREHLFGAIAHWIQTYNIDGLRLDAADCMNLQFLSRLSSFTRRHKPDFLLMGEVVHGDYRRWIEKGKIHSITNYELYDALHKSHNAGDYTRLAHSLQRQFGHHGVYQGLKLYNFIDNHDVERIASRLKNSAHLYPIYLLLFTLPGIPSIYYGSEWGIVGSKQGWSDAPLRPAIQHPFHYPKAHPDLMPVISRLANLHQHSPALQTGGWHLVYESRQTLAFIRHCESEQLLIIVHLGARRTKIQLHLPWHHGELIDLLNPGEHFQIHHSQTEINLNPHWGRILRWSRH